MTPARLRILIENQVHRVEQLSATVVVGHDEGAHRRPSAEVVPTGDRLLPADLLVTLEHEAGQFFLRLVVDRGASYHPADG